MLATRYVFTVAIASCVAGAALTYAYTSVAPHKDSMLAAAAIGMPYTPVPSGVPAPLTTATGSSSTSTPGTSASSSSGLDQSQTQSGSSTPTGHQYKLLFNVDMCTFNTLGKDGWQPIQYGQASDNNDYLQISGGKDENCQNTRTTRAFIWVLFERELSS